MRRTFNVLAFVAAGLAAAGTTSAQTLDEIIARNLQAKGGLDVLKATNTVKMVGRFKTQGVEMPMTTFAKRPNLVRREAEVTPPPMPGATAAPSGKQKMVTASDGNNVWVMMGTSPAQEVPAAQAEGMKHDAAEFDSIFVDYKERGHRLELVGKEIKDGKPQYHLKVTRRDGPVQHYYLDGDTGLESKIITDVNQNGMKLTVETELSDYRRIDGRMVPFRTKQSSNGQLVGEMSLESIEFNLPLDDTLFRFPSGK